MARMSVCNMSVTLNMSWGMKSFNPSVESMKKKDFLRWSNLPVTTVTVQLIKMNAFPKSVLV